MTISKPAQTAAAVFDDRFCCDRLPRITDAIAMTSIALVGAPRANLIGTTMEHHAGQRCHGSRLPLSSSGSAIDHLGAYGISPLPKDQSSRAESTRLMKMSAFETFPLT
jgi:hypothetical protein